MPSSIILCLMGPTASGKTSLAMELAQQFPIDIISVDSAMVYRGMDIGTAKPTPVELQHTPHRLIDMMDPAESYSAGQFCIDAHHEITQIIAAGRIPLLVGGTMLYFRALQQGLSKLPRADAAVRMRLTQEAEELGWQALHQRLQAIDPIAAARISLNDAQRIQRALEIHAVTGTTVTEFYRQNVTTAQSQHFVNIGLMVDDRTTLAGRIQQRFQQMLQRGFVEEVVALYERGDLHADMPSMRAVGYRQIWDYLAGNTTQPEMQERAIIATRQLAKRQLTWLHSWPQIQFFTSGSPHLPQQVQQYIAAR